MTRVSNKALALAAAVSTLATASAFAADLPSRRDVPVAPVQTFAPPAFTWTGFYVGANVGYGFNADSRVNTVGTPGFVGLIPAGIVPSELKGSGEGFVGGAQIGYNWQFGQFVYGLETDIQFTDMGKRETFIGNPVLGTQLATTADSELRYLGTLRARLGYTPIDRLLIYATGGLAYADVKTSLGVAGVQAPGLGWAGSKSEVRFGWTLGAGAEYALTNNWTIKGEYLYYDLGGKTVNTTPNAAAAAAVPGVAYSGKAETNGHIVRAGINYKF
jgi:outer membrane immunogenic protein